MPDESIDLIVTDPPYESLEKHRAIGTTTRLKHSKASSNDWFSIFPNHRFPELFRECYRVLKKDRHLYLFCDPETMFVAKPDGEDAGFRFWKPLVWDKVNMGMGYHYRAQYEFVLFFEKGKRKLNDLGVSDILRAKRIHRGYPTEKLDGTGSTDPDGDTLVYAWRAGSDLALPLLGSDPSVTVDQDPGTTVEYSLRVWDDDFQMSEAIAQVEIVDTQPPSLEVLDVATDCLWAPDHSMHLFRLGDEIVAQASDACDGAVSVRIVDVQSNQPRNATGDGSTEPDVVFGDQAFCIRSERQGVAAAGRTYTVVLEAHDAVGNASTQEILIDVPRDQRPASRCLTGGLVPAVEDDDPRCTESLPVAASTDLPAGAVPEIPRVPPAGCAIGRGRTSPLVAVSVLVVAVLMRQRSRRRHAR